MLLIAGNGFALLAFGVGQLLIKDKRAANYWSFAFFAYAGASFVSSVTVKTSPFSSSPLALWLDFPIISLVGPLYFSYFSRLADPRLRFDIRQLGLFLPTALSAIAIPFGCSGIGAALRPVANILSSVAILWVIACCAFFLKLAIRLSREGDNRTVSRLRFLIRITYGALAWAIVFFASVVWDFGALPLALSATLLIMIVYFYHLRHPELLATSLATPSPRRKGASGRSKVAGLDVESAIARLTRAMEEDRPYLKDDLSLPELAAKTGLSPHQLSEILNREMGSSFKAYINRYRVGEARRILRERPDATIIEVALECGFRSKSAFNDIFREETGTTPTEYRRRADAGGGESE